MAKRIPFSRESLNIYETAQHYTDMSHAVRQFFSATSPYYEVRFAGYKVEEVRMELNARLAELDRHSIMTLLATVEAAFRIDYLQRSYLNKKDRISRQLRQLYTEQETRASLEEDIFEIWKRNTIGSAPLISDPRGAFKFRHWLAHGRYGIPKFGQKYDHVPVYALSLAALNGFPLLVA